MSASSHPKVAIVADWLTIIGGAESVIKSFGNVFPDADIYTTVLTPEMEHFLHKKKDEIQTSFLQFLPIFLRKKHPFLLPFLPKAIESLDLSEYEIILSSSSFIAKGSITHPSQTHICYCHTPTRYFWEQWQEYLHTFPLPRILKKVLPRYFTHARIWDYHAAQRPDFMIANSDFIARQITKHYHRSSIVIPPPVETDVFFPEEQVSKGDFYLSLGRLVPQKKIELLITAFRLLPDKKLVIAGTGRQEQKLKKMAEGHTNISFVGFVSDTEVLRLLRQARATLFPQIEDAGITALESIAVGTPVIAYDHGGIPTLLDSKTGVFFPQQTPQSLIQGITDFEARESDFSLEYFQKYIQKFSRKNFESQIRDYVSQKDSEKKQNSSSTSSELCISSDT